MLSMTPQEIQLCKNNTNMMSLIIQFIEFINSEVDFDKTKRD